MQAIQAIGLKAALSNLRQLPKQIAFATSRAINDSALAVQKHTTETLLPSKFTLRSRGAKWWKPRTRFGFNIRFSKKDHLEAIVGSKADWLGLQETGGTKTPRQGRFLALPVEARPTPTSPIPKAMKPGKLLRGRAWIMQTPNGPAVFRRDGGRRVLLWTFKPRVKIPKRLDFVDTETPLAAKEFNRRFPKRFLEAISTAK